MATIAGVEIHPATASDHAAVQQLWESNGLEAATSDEWDALMSGAMGAVLLAVYEGSIIGTGVATFDGWRAYIYHVAVHDEHRRHGIAHELLAAAEQYLMNAGARYVYVAVDQDNPEALALVGSAGYLPGGEMVLAKQLNT